MKGTKRRRDPFILVFCVFIAILILFFVVITGKIALSPVCSSTDAHLCVVDTGSVVGLVAAVFGVAATLLAFLGAFAVAYWWAELDKRVKEQVDAHVNELIEQRLKEQEGKFQDQIAQNVKAFDEQIAQNVKAFDEQITQLKGYFQSIRDELFRIAMLFEPWDLEVWAKELIREVPSSDVAWHMVRRYLKEVDNFLPDAPKPSEFATLRFAPEGFDLLYCWNAALRWHRVVEQQNNPELVLKSTWNIEQRKPKVKKYLQENPNDPGAPHGNPVEP